MRLYLSAILAAAASGIPGLFLRRRGGEVAAGLLGLAAGLGLWASIQVLAGSPGGAFPLRTAALGSPGLLALDPLAAFFAIPVLLLSACAGLYSLGYWEGRRGNTPVLRLVFGLLVAFLALLVGAALYATLAVATLTTTWSGLDTAPDNPEKSPNVAQLGQALMGVREATPIAPVTNLPPRAGPVPTRERVGYLLPFEIVSVHLLVVLIGAAYLARAKRKRETARAEQGVAA